MSATTTAAAVAAWSVAPGALRHRYGRLPRMTAARRPVGPTTVIRRSIRAGSAPSPSAGPCTGPCTSPFTKRTDPPGPDPVG